MQRLGCESISVFLLFCFFFLEFAVILPEAGHTPTIHEAIRSPDLRNMASGGDGEQERFPQFTPSNYEIPSWQIEWNKPWYQQFDEKRNVQGKYNSRGHVVDCRCSLCEEDMESAFSPQPSDIPHVFNISTENSGKEAFPYPPQVKKEKPQNQTSERVILFSDLPEVTPTSSKQTAEERNTSARNISENRTSRDTEGISGLNSDALFNSITTLSSIQSISGRVTDIQTRVNNFSGAKDSREFIVLRGLLVSTLAELNRINASQTAWLQQAKHIAMQSIHDLLTQLKSKISDDDDF